MELTIGIRDAAAPLTIETEITKEELKSELANALTTNSFLEIAGNDGSVTIIPATSLGYVRVAKSEQRHVGFGFV